MNSEYLPRDGHSHAATTPSVRATAWLTSLAILLPWLNPYAGGPSSSVSPWLFSAVCIAVAYGVQHPGRPNAALLFGLAGISAWATLRTGLSLDTVALTAACLLIFMAASMAAGGSKRPQFMQAIALAWLLAAVASTAIALCQYFGLADGLAPWVNTSDVGVAYANLRQRNQLASLTVIGMAAVFWLLPGLRPWHALAAMAWLAVGNAVTTSRTGLLQLLLLGLLVCMWPGARWERAKLWMAGLLVYAVAAVALPSVLEATTGGAAVHLWGRVATVDECSSRMVLWSNVLELIAHKPWLGWGWGELDFAHYATLYAGPRFCDILDNAHNLPLHLAVEMGIPAALLACGGMLWAVARAKPWAEADPVRQMAWAVLAVIGVHSLLEYPLWYGPFQVTLGLCLGLLWPADSAPADQRVASRARSSLIGLTLAIGVVAACAYAAWDYRRVGQIYLAPEVRAPGLQDDPLPEIRKSWLFRNQARFAELTITPLTQANAQWSFDNAAALLHYSPEPRVIEKLIESAVVLHRQDEALLHLVRFRAAFPDAYAGWTQVRPLETAP